MNGESFESLLDAYQCLRRVGEYILIFGLAGDFFVIAFLHNRREKIVSLFCTALITLGVVIEVHAGGGADDVVRQMRTPRSLNEAQQSALADKLRPFGAKEVVFFEVSDVDPEIAGVMGDLSRALASAGWKAGIDRLPPLPPLEFRAPDTGILVVVSPAAPDKGAIPAAQMLVSLLCKDGLTARLSQAFLAPAPPIDSRLKIVVYSKSLSTTCAKTGQPSRWSRKIENMIVNAACGKAN